MKGLQGLILAIGAGMAAAMFNWAYLNSRSQDIETVYFIGIAEDKTVGRGDRLQKSDLAPIEIPLKNAGNLDTFAYRFDDAETVVSMAVTRQLTPGSMLLREDLKTPAPKLDLDAKRADERWMAVAVDSREFVPAFINPGSSIEFHIARPSSRAPTAAGGTPTPAGQPPVASGEVVSSTEAEIVGPFTVLSVGNRLGSVTAMQAARIRQSQPNVIGILVTVTGGRLDPEAQRLQELLAETTPQAIKILIPPAEEP